MSKGRQKGKNDAFKKSSSPWVEVKLLKIKTLLSMDFFFKESFLMNKLYHGVILSQLREFE